MSLAAPLPNPRVGWIDSARGLAILLVPLWHGYLTARIGGGFPDGAALAIDLASGARIPVFFLASGILFAGQVHRPLAEIVRRRILVLVWLLALWTVVGSLVQSVVPLYPWDDDDAPLPGLARAVFDPQGNLWFIYALLVFTVAAVLVRRLNGPLRLVAASAIFAVLIAYDQIWDTFQTRNMVQFYPFYMGGLLAADAIRAFVASPRRVVVLLACGIMGLAAVRLLPLPFALDKGLEGLFGVGIGLAVAVRVQAVPVIASALAAAGKRSLDIYLVHQPLLAFAFAGLFPSGKRSGRSPSGRFSTRSASAGRSSCRASRGGSEPAGSSRRRGFPSRDQPCRDAAKAARSASSAA